MDGLVSRTATAINRMIERVTNRVRNLVRPGKITAVSDTDGVQTVGCDTSDEGESHSDIEHLQPYGLSANPPIGASGLLVSIGGRGNNAYLVSCDSRANRPKAQLPGETTVYSMYGNSVEFKLNGDVIVTQGLAGKVYLGGNVATVAPSVETLVKVEIDKVIAILNAHVHSGVLAGLVSSGPLVTPLGSSTLTGASKVEVL